jgi:salicylate hydroxylase
MHTPADFKVAIIGGGIGGLTCALSLAEQCPGIRIDVYEQAAQYKEIGAGVGIAANAISGERNNIHRSLRRWDNGEEIVTVDALYDQDEIRQLSVHRAELLKILFDAIRERGIATLHNNKRSVKVVV